MKEKEIGELYREKLTDYQSTPPENLWDQIQKDPTLQKYNKKQQLRKISTYAGISVAIVAVVVIAAIQIFTSDNTENAPKPVAQTEKMSSIAPVDTNATVVTPHVSSNNSTGSVDKLFSYSSPKESQTNLVSSNKEVQNEDEANNSIIAESQLPVPSVESLKPSVNKYPVVPSVPVSLKDEEQQPENAPEIQEVQSQSISNPSDELNTQKTKVGILKYSRDTSVCRNSEVVLYVENAAKVRWSTGSTEPTIAVYPDDPMMLYVEVTTFESKDTLINMRVDVFDCDLFVPTAFTPNADGLNDEFLVHAPMGITNYECIVFDPASRILFKSNSITDGWDGTADGKRLPHGAYFYVITYRDPLNEKHVLKGQIILVR